MPEPGRPVLIVEDDDAIRSAVEIALTMAGYEVRLASNGREGISSLEQQSPSLVLLDMRMPVLDGWGFAKEAHNRGFDPPILVMTTREDAEQSARDIGAAGFIGKPFEVSALLDKVSELRAP
jgi:DNA-binding response OmpR family regulator